jgi:hypothetical protein
MGIFNKDEEKTEFDKIGVNVIKPYRKDGRWVFDKDGHIYDMAPAGITDAVLSPMILGGDRLITAAAQAKGICNPENGFQLLFSENYFPGCDAKFTLQEDRFDGWVYSIESENFQVAQGQQAWVCSYMKLYYAQAPKVLYLKMESHE